MCLENHVKSLANVFFYGQLLATIYKWMLYLVSSWESSIHGQTWGAPKTCLETTCCKEEELKF